MVRGIAEGVIMGPVRMVIGRSGVAVGPGTDSIDGMRGEAVV